ncbi:MAG: acyl carrier protein [Oscillospiraceae bacterium]|jgi:acyl carrier protein|nr:acyl carrier protein [Oscillospiraceae bacterium]
MSVYEKVTKLIHTQLKVDPKNISMDSRLLEDLKADSANVMMLVMDLEQDTGVVMEDDALMTLKTVGDVVRYIETHS